MSVLTSNNIYFGKKEKVSYSCTRSSSLLDHIIHRALVKIPSGLICIIESIRDMSVDISCRKRPGAEEDLCMPSDFAAAGGLFTPPAQCSRLSSRQRLG
jgi:hypothetical protein